MVANSREYQKEYMRKYIKTKGGELYTCECGKAVKKYDKTRHNNTKYHIHNADKLHTEQTLSDIEQLRKEIEELKKKMA